MRNIFSKPKPITVKAYQFQVLLTFNDGRYTEEQISDIMEITPRAVRKIVEEFNFRKYLDCSNAVKYQVIDNKYHIVTKHTDSRDMVLYKRFESMRQGIEAYKIYLIDLGGDKKQLQMSLDQILESELISNG